MGRPRYLPPAPPRKRPARSTFDVAIKRASLLLPHEIAEIMDSMNLCLSALREGKASENHLIVFRTHIKISLGIEDSGVVAGLKKYFDEALRALEAIRLRSMSGGQWRQSALYAAELATLSEAVRLYDFQIRQVSAGEICAVTNKLIAQTKSAGGKSVRCNIDNIQT